MQMSFFSPHLSCWQENRFTLPWQLWVWTWEMHKCWSRKNKNVWTGRGSVAGTAQSQRYKAVLGSIHLELPMLTKSSQTFFFWFFTTISAFHGPLIAPSTDPQLTQTELNHWTCSACNCDVGTDSKVTKLRIIRYEPRVKIYQMCLRLNIKGRIWLRKERCIAYLQMQS